MDHAKQRKKKAMQKCKSKKKGGGELDRERKKRKWDVKQPDYKNNNKGNGKNIPEHYRSWVKKGRSSIKIKKQIKETLRKKKKQLKVFNNLEKKNKQQQKQQNPLNQWREWSQQTPATKEILKEDSKRPNKFWTHFSSKGLMWVHTKMTNSKNSFR